MEEVTWRSELGSTDEPIKDVGALMEEYWADPDAYMEKRGRVLRGEHYDEIRQQVLAEQNEALREIGRTALRWITRTFSRHTA